MVPALPSSVSVAGVWDTRRSGRPHSLPPETSECWLGVGVWIKRWLPPRSLGPVSAWVCIRDPGQRRRGRWLICPRNGGGSSESLIAGGLSQEEGPGGRIPHFGIVKMLPRDVIH